MFFAEPSNTHQSLPKFENYTVGFALVLFYGEACSCHTPFTNTAPGGLGFVCRIPVDRKTS